VCRYLYTSDPYTVFFSWLEVNGRVVLECEVVMEFDADEFKLS